MSTQKGELVVVDEAVAVIKVVAIAVIEFFSVFDRAVFARCARASFIDRAVAIIVQVVVAGFLAHECVVLRSSCE